MGRGISLTGFGEPTVHPRFAEIVDSLRTVCGAKRPICMITNGTTLSERTAELLRGGIGSIAVSLNAAAPETYWKVAHHKFDTVTEGIRAFAQALPDEDRRRIALHFVVDNEVMSEMPAFVRLAHELGLSRVRFDEYRLVREADFDLTLLRDNEGHSRLLAEARAEGDRLGVTVIGRGFFSEKPPVFSRELYCKSPFIEASVDPYGNVSPCCYTGQSMGNAFKEGFEAVWNGEFYNTLRGSRWLGACGDCVLFHRFEDATTHVASNMRLAPAAEEFIRGWEAKVGATRRSEEGAPQLDLTVYDRVAARSPEFSVVFGEAVQHLLFSDFSRHYFEPNSLRGDLRDTRNRLDRALVDAVRSDPSLALAAGDRVSAAETVGSGWLVESDRVKAPHRLISSEVPATLFLRREAGRGLRLEVTAEKGDFRVMSSLDGLKPRSPRRTRRGSLIWDMPEPRGDEVSVVELRLVPRSAWRAMWNRFCGVRETEPATITARILEIAVQSL